MSEQYDEYIEKHRDNLCKAAMWLKVNIPEVIDDLKPYEYIDILTTHDQSKYEPDEYSAYDQYFYGAHRTKDDFDNAWLLHIHRNPHHWQHWVLINDDLELGTRALDIPYRYVIEMICDWWSFSFDKGYLYEIFNWYDAHKDYMILSNHTRELVEEILAKIKTKLDKINN